MRISFIIKCKGNESICIVFNFVRKNDCGQELHLKNIKNWLELF